MKRLCFGIVVAAFLVGCEEPKTPCVDAGAYRYAMNVHTDVGKGNAGIVSKIVTTTSEFSVRGWVYGTFGAPVSHCGGFVRVGDDYFVLKQ